MPIAVELERLTGRRAARAREDPRDGHINILFVGRIVPNKRSRITSGSPRSTSATSTATTGSSSSGGMRVPRYFFEWIQALIV
jgi:hypothetical protein